VLEHFPSPDQYVSLRNQKDLNSLGKAFEAISLFNYQPDFRAQVVSDTLFKVVSNTPINYLWILASSAPEEQFFLNSCEIVAMISAIYSHHTNICSLLCLCRSIISHLEKKGFDGYDDTDAYNTLWSNTSPTTKDYYTMIINKFKKDITNIENTIVKYCQKLPSLKQLYSLNQDLCYALQLVSVVFRPHRKVLSASKSFLWCLLNDSLPHTTSGFPVFEFGNRFLPKRPETIWCTLLLPFLFLTSH